MDSADRLDWLAQLLQAAKAPAMPPAETITLAGTYAVTKRVAVLRFEYSTDQAVMGVAVEIPMDLVCGRVDSNFQTCEQLQIAGNHRMAVQVQWKIAPVVEERLLSAPTILAPEDVHKIDSFERYLAVLRLWENRPDKSLLYSFEGHE